VNVTGLDVQIVPVRCGPAVRGRARPQRS